MSAKPAPSIEPPESRLRERLAKRLSQHLERVGHPRAQMVLMVSATGSAGFLLDWLMLKAGLARMSLRYALAVALSYGVFLLLLKLWLVFHVRRQERASSGSSGWDLDFSTGGSGGSGGGGGGGVSASSFSGGGGGSGGGGASAAWADEGVAPLRVAAVPIPAQPASASGGSSSSGSGFGIDLDGDEALAIVVVVVAVAGAFLAAGYLVVQAPVILGEVLLDGTLSTGLYRRLKNLEPHEWLETALKKTVLPFLAVALLAGTAGHFIQKAAPEARSIGGFVRHLAR